MKQGVPKPPVNEMAEGIWPEGGPEADMPAFNDAIEDIGPDEAVLGKAAFIGIDYGSGDRSIVSAISPNGRVDVVSIVERKKPKRDRAAYMRDYRARKRAERAGR